VEIAMKRKPMLWIGLILLTACAPAPASPLSSPTAAPPSPIPAATQALPPGASPTITAPAFTAIPTLTPAQTTIAPAFCADPQPVSLINSLKTSMLTSDSALLGLLVHPELGMEVRWVRYGKVITYTSEQALFLYETTFEADWGDEPGSGLSKKGAFHDVIVPDLVKIFGQPYTLHCNELQYGGATYELEYPYDGNYYSVYFEGTDQYGFLDWHTWVIGMDYSNGKPYITALMQFFWEP
jgi:hypothetical protein